MFRSLIVVIALGGAMTAAQAQKSAAAGALEAYEGEAQFALLMCSIKFKTHQSIAALQEMGRSASADDLQKSDYRSCIRENKQAIKRSYDAALRSVRKPAGKAALKEHYIAVVSQLKGVEPASSERQFQYDQRQAKNEARTREAWTRFEIEQ